MVGLNLWTKSTWPSHFKHVTRLPQHLPSANNGQSRSLMVSPRFWFRVEMSSNPIFFVCFSSLFVKHILWKKYNCINKNYFHSMSERHQSSFFAQTQNEFPVRPGNKTKESGGFSTEHKWSFCSKLSITHAPAQTRKDTLRSSRKRELSCVANYRASLQCRTLVC